MGRIADIASGRTSVGGGRLSGVVSSESAVNEKNKYYIDVEKKNRYAEAIKKAEKAQEEAQKAADNLKFWEGIAGIPKQIYQAGKETGAAVLDTTARTSFIEPIRNTVSGISNVVTGPSNVPASLKFEQGVQESKGRKTLFEKVSGKELTNQDGTINWDAGRQFIGRAAEAPTYAYAGAVKGAELVGKGLLSRILTRTAKSLPEATVNTGIQQFEQGNTENVGTNFLANALLLSGISNIAGEVRFSKDVAKKTIDDIESELGKLSLSEKADIIESIQQGVKPSDIVDNVRKVKNNEVNPEELASKINEQAGVKESTPDVKTVFRGRDATVDETGAPYRFFTESEQAAGKYADIKKTPDGKAEVISEKVDASKYKLVDAKDYLDELENKETISNFDGVKFKEPNGEMAYAKITKEQKPIDTTLPDQPKVDTTPKRESVTAKKMNERFGKDEQLSTEYDVISINNESNKAASLILKDRNKAIKTAFTDTGSNTEKIAILNELFEKSVVDNDHGLSTVLFNRIKQLSTQTAQSLNMFKALTEVNPHYAYMSEVVSARLNGVKVSAGNIMDALKKESKQSRVRTKVAKQTKELKETLSTSVKYEKAQKVFNDLICK